MSQRPADPISLALFCKVVDNFGDIGICWRLSRQLHREHGIAVTLWVDDLASFRRICPEVDTAQALQDVQGIAVRHWRGQDGSFAPEDVADIVIEFFGCDIPPGYIEAMARRQPRALWFNYEGLSAEDWVEGCHRLPSSHPRLPLTKYFFFPGFTERTGGLLHEAGLDEARARFQADPGARAAFLSGLGVGETEARGLLVSLFCYPHAPVSELFAAWEAGDRPVTCLAFEGVATGAVQAFTGGGGQAGSVATRGALTVRVLPFVPQPDYDRLLWACGLNFVRGEDSWVRAQWADRPFVWHIYPQDENLHHKKLEAFLKRYAGGQPAAAAFMRRWNGAGAPAAGGNEWQDLWRDLWRDLHAALPGLSGHAAAWHRQVLAHGDCAANLVRFADALWSMPVENRV